MLDGLFVVDKPAGWTSHDVVARVRRVLGQRRVGHAGTLDPDATGVLLVGAGRVTRLLRFLQDTGKAYEGTVVFGVATDTLDSSGVVLDREPMSVTADEVAGAATRFVGEIDQVPPMVSAVRLGGTRLYELARRGEEVERPPRRVRIDRLTITGFEPGPYPEATFEAECSSGTYMRSLAHDLGGALGGVAHLRRLRRTRVASFTLAEAATLEEIAAEPATRLRPPADAVRDLPPVTVDAERARAVMHGTVFPARDLLGDTDIDGPVAILDDEGDLCAVYRRQGVALKPAVVLATRSPDR